MKKFVYVVIFIAVIFLASRGVFASNLQYGFNIDPKTTKLNYPNVKPGSTIYNKLKITLLDDIKVNFTVLFHNSMELADMPNWIKFPEGTEFTIDGRKPGPQDLLIPFEITLPQNIQPGTYRYALQTQPTTPKDQLFSGNGVGLRLTSARGIEFKFSVAGQKKHRLILEQMSTALVPSSNENKKKQEDLKITIFYKSEGNSILQPSLYVVVKNASGKIIYDKKLAPNILFPGDNSSQDVFVPNMNFPIGWVDINAELSYSLVSLDGKIDEAETKAGKAYVRIYIIPWLEIMSIFGLVIIISGMILYRRLRLKLLMVNAILYKIQNNDTLQSVAMTTATNPKHIIMLNKLKFPYFLTPNTTIFIPKSKH